MQSRLKLGLAALAMVMAAASAAKAEQWVDYAPGKGVYVKTYVHVEPNKIDDYLVGLKKTWAPGEEIMKKAGLLLSYSVQVNVNAQTTEPNVVMIEQYANFAAMDPNKALDLKLKAEFDKAFPKPQADAIQAERGKWRTFVKQEMWAPVDFNVQP
ncbi:hypothetical protein [uncultured Caulobacter sp.]|uniref:hypothetical protein n=1 Tax=uncultured Caulobacter sp. TaxID=158749 RepID=UPI0026319423|nr:hypothetical protein [uncultured Caulobacter sp.]